MTVTRFTIESIVCIPDQRLLKTHCHYTKDLRARERYCRNHNHPSPLPVVGTLPVSNRFFRLRVTLVPQKQFLPNKGVGVTQSMQSSQIIPNDRSSGLALAYHLRKEGGGELFDMYICVYIGR